MPSWVPTHVDLFRYFPASACVPDARQIAGYVGSPIAIDLPAHGFTSSSLVTFAARTGAALDSMIDPLVTYTVVPVSARFFRLLGVTLAGDGVGLPFVFEDVIPKIDTIMAEVGSYIIANAKAYAAPWTTPPAWAPRLAAHLGAPDVADALRIAESRYPVERTIKRAEIAEKFVEHLRAGEPMTDGVGPIDATDGYPDNAALAAQDAEPTPWRNGGAL
jgi:hypothetical protein